MKRISRGSLVFAATLLSLLLMPISYGDAASVRQVTLDEMLRQCQFVFEGKVTGLRAKENGPKRIHTFVTFKIQDTIKGKYPSDTITLSFLGGTVGEVTLAISDMHVPQIGEHGIYFVESLNRSQVHPLYGWSQGHFIVKRDATGLDKVMTNRKLPIIEVRGEVPAVQGGGGEKTLPLLSNKVARGLVVSQKQKDSRGLTVDEFKKALREKIGKIQ